MRLSLPSLSSSPQLKAMRQVWLSSMLHKQRPPLSSDVPMLAVNTHTTHTTHTQLGRELACSRGLHVVSTPSPTPKPGLHDAAWDTGTLLQAGSGISAPVSAEDILLREGMQPHRAS